MRMSSLASRIAAKLAHIERREEDMHDYQRQAFEFLLANPFCALFIDTGLGKTIIVLTLLVFMLQRGMCKKVLIVAPVRVAAQTWPNEIAAWEHTAWLGHTVIRAEDDDAEVISAGKLGARRGKALAEAQIETLRELGQTDDGIKEYVRKRTATAAQKAQTAKKEELRQRRRKSNADIHVVNREALQWLVDQYSEWTVKTRNGKKRRVRKVVGWPYDVVVLDESSSFKDYSTARFKALSAVRQQGWIKRLIELTATPAAESYMGLFAQVFLMDKGKRFGRFITTYRDNYFVKVGKTEHQNYKLRPGADKQIGDCIADICMVMKSSDYLEEQEPLFLNRMIDMSEFELAQYRRFERESILDLDDGDYIEAETAAALSAKLLQLASGAVYDKDRRARLIHNHKIEDLAELVEELQGSPLLVAYWYKSSLARLRKAFPDAVVMDKAGKVVSRHGPWNTGKVKMLLVHPASVGHGLNMQYGPGHDLYMFDQCWSYELFYQLYRRIHRQGQVRQCRIHLPQMRHTNDVFVVKRLGLKEDAQEALFNRIRAMRRRMLERRLAA